MDVARAVPHPEHVPRLGQVGGQGIVRAVLGVVRTKAPLGALGRPADPQDCAIGIERQPGELKSLDRVVRHVANQRSHGLHHRLRSADHPTRHRASRGQPMQPRKAQEHRVAGEHWQMREPPPTRDQQTHDGQHQSHSTVVAALAERLAKLPWEMDRDEVAAQQLQPAVRRDPFV